MGSHGIPLGPTLANIFVGYLESKIAEDDLPLLYCRFVDDTFSIFRNNKNAFDFFSLLNQLHKNLKFTMKSKIEGRIPFMDVDIKKAGNELSRIVYRKPTFTGLYTRWESFCPKVQKINLIKCLVQRAIKICSPGKLSTELDQLRTILRDNGYPDNIVERTFKIVMEKDE